MFDGTGILLLALIIVCVIAIIYFGWWAISEGELPAGGLCVALCGVGVILGWSFFSSHPRHHRNHIEAVADLKAEHVKFDHLSTQDGSVNVWAGTCRFSVRLVRDHYSKKYWPAVDQAAYQVPPKRINTEGEIGGSFLKQVAQLPECEVVQR